MLKNKLKAIITVIGVTTICMGLISCSNKEEVSNKGNENPITYDKNNNAEIKNDTEEKKEDTSIKKEEKNENNKPNKTNKEEVKVDNPKKEDIKKEPTKKEDIKNNKDIDQPKYDLNDYRLLLVNKSNKMPTKEDPKDLVIPNVSLRTASKMTSQLRKEAAIATEKMFNAAKKEGINLIFISGYRTHQYQEGLYNNKVARSGKAEADKYVARPGHSEHQTGLVLDLLSSEYGSLDEGFKNTKAYKWLMKNMADYGFILRYPKGREHITGYSYEPWHLRYVGKDAAREINKRGLTLEEFHKENKK